MGTRRKTYICVATSMPGIRDGVATPKESRAVTRFPGEEQRVASGSRHTPRPSTQASRLTSYKYVKWETSAVQSESPLSVQPRQPLPHPPLFLFPSICAPQSSFHFDHDFAGTTTRCGIPKSLSGIVEAIDLFHHWTNLPASILQGSPSRSRGPFQTSKAYHVKRHLIDIYMELSRVTPTASSAESTSRRREARHRYHRKSGYSLLSNG